MRKLLVAFFLVLAFARIASGADTVPTDIEMPGTQPLEISSLESPNKCDNCHGGYNAAVEPAHNWRGSMMANAGRDPIFWATLAIAEQDFDGSGDLCLRCHSTGGWLAGRSTPTDGSGLQAGDSDGVECDYCHKLTNPNDLEHVGVMNEPFLANDGEPAPRTQGWYGSGMSSMWGGNDKLGPYNDADARHQFIQSDFHRSPDFCGTCHDVSNPAVGNLAHNHGTLANAPGVTANSEAGGAVDGKAAFNNPPYAYGIVERTFSEHMSSPISSIQVNDFHTSGLPEGGAFEGIYLATTNGGISADYENPYRVRTYTCQTCHMRAVTGTGANKRGVPLRHDLPLHDMTGGNYWMAAAIEYLDGQGKLRLGGGLTADQRSAMQDAAARAREQLQLAATLELEGNTLEIVNHTGHKLITGYPEGRRMWLNVKWYDAEGGLLREDGAYGPLDGQDGRPLAKGINGVVPESILDLEDDELYIFEAHMGMTRDWASQIVTAANRGLPLTYDRLGNEAVYTLGDLAAGNAGTELETFHFVLNNTVTKDNRIPPFEMSYDEAQRRNALPVPADQYDGAPGGTFDHYAEIGLNPPAGAASATIDLVYQPTSWEYIQFLYLANTPGNGFLDNEGANMLEAWAETGMAAPAVMASTTWGGTPPGPACELAAPLLESATATTNSVSLSWAPVEGAATYLLYYDQSGKSQYLDTVGCDGPGPCTYTDSGLNSGQSYCYKVTAMEGECESAFSNISCASTQPGGQTSSAGVSTITTGSVVKSGKGKNATEQFVVSDSFNAGDTVVIRLLVDDEAGSPVADATVQLNISGPESVGLVSSGSGPDGIAEASWATDAPNRKGNGGTATGTYTIAVTGIESPGHDWDGVTTTTTITLN